MTVGRLSRSLGQHASPSGKGIELLVWGRAKCTCILLGHWQSRQITWSQIRAGHKTHVNYCVGTQKYIN